MKRKHNTPVHCIYFIFLLIIRYIYVTIQEFTQLWSDISYGVGSGQLAFFCVEGREKLRA